MPLFPSPTPATVCPNRHFHKIAVPGTQVLQPFVPTERP